MKKVFGILKSAAYNDKSDEIDIFCKFIGSRLRSYDDPTNNASVKQALCNVFKTVVGYFAPRDC